MPTWLQILALSVKQLVTWAQCYHLAEASVCLGIYMNRCEDDDT